MQSVRFDPRLLRRCWFLAGPTAAGKSEVGVCLARRIDAEIVSLDSMSLYRGMDVGTAKPPPELRREISHHLIDVIDPHEEYSLADYVAAAEAECRDIAGRGRTPLFVGGTGLYLRAVLRGVWQGPPPDWELRRRLETEARGHEPNFLHQRLQAVDPEAATRLHQHDHRRLIRALEVFHVTGRPLSDQQRHGPLPADQRPPHVYWLAPPRDWLYERINRRVEAMFAGGLVEEVRRLMASDQPLSRTARQALGYKELIDCLETGGSIDEARELIQTRTRQFAKRQHTWFRNLAECRPIAMTGHESPEELADLVLQCAARRDL